MIDFVAAGFDLAGLYTVGNKKRFGFMINMIADVVWIYVGYTAGLPGLSLIAGVALVFNMRNWLKWHE